MSWDKLYNHSRYTNKLLWSTSVFHALLEVKNTKAETFLCCLVNRSRAFHCFNQMSLLEGNDAIRTVMTSPGRSGARALSVVSSTTSTQQAHDKHTTSTQQAHDKHTLGLLIKPLVLLQCNLLLQGALQGCRINLKEELGVPNVDAALYNGWPQIQLRILNELVFASRKICDNQMANRWSRSLLLWKELGAGRAIKIVLQPFVLIVYCLDHKHLNFYLV